MAAPAIQVQHLCKNYGIVQAVDRVSFEIQPGELVGFLGNNGAGKSTTMRILTTYLPASSGTARVAGHDVMYESDAVRRTLGYLQESVPLYPDMRVEEYLEYRARIKGVERTVRRSRIDDGLARCRIKEVRRRLLGTLSKGYRQRVGLADTLLADPAVLILDEPLSGLDPVQQDETLASIKALHGRHTVLFSSHHLPDVEKICDRVLIIHRGRTRFDGKLSDFSQAVPMVVIEARGPFEKLAAILKAIDGVTAVREAAQPADGVSSLELTVTAGRDVREAVATALVTAGHAVRRLDTKTETLEAIYMKATMGGAA
jgi:ABC-2 type transport system ATP-binding protein